MIKEQKVTGMYEPCPACAESRGSGDLDSAASCPRCKGTGMRRTRESWICNACGKSLCPESDGCPYGLVEAKVSGGFNSPALSDCTNYEFSICENCLRKIFDEFAIKPMISEYMVGVLGGDDMPTDEKYEEEVAARKKANEENAASTAEFFKLYEEGRCAEREHDPSRKDINPLREYCAREGVARLVYENSDWPYAKRWLCPRHLRDAFVTKEATIYISGREPLTWAARSKRGLELLEKFKAGKSPHLPSEEDAAIAISTLFPLLMSKKHNVHASSELARISCAAPPRALEWVADRVPLNFRPDEDAAARLANDWLAWGKSQEYDNAVATAFLGYDARTIWDESARNRNIHTDDDESEQSDEKP